MSACDKIRDVLSSYLEGELAGAEKSNLETHLEACDACTMTVSRLRALSSKLHKMAPVSTSEAFHVVLKSRIRRELEPKESFLDKIALFFKANAVPAYSLSVLSLLLLTYVSVDIYTHLNEEDGNTILTNELASPAPVEIETFQQQTDFTQERISFPVDLIPARTARHERRAPVTTTTTGANNQQATPVQEQADFKANDQLVQPATITF